MQQTHKKIFVLGDRGKDLSKQWYIHFKYKGERKRASRNINQGKTVDERLALAEKYIEELRIKYPPPAPNEADREKIYRELEFSKINLEPKSYQTYRSNLDHLFSWLDGRAVTTDNLREYFQEYRKTHELTGTYDARRRINTYFKRAGYGHLLDPIKISKGTHQPLRYYQPHQCKQLLNYMRENDGILYLHCLFIYYMALRNRKELLKIRICDIFFEEKKICIRADIHKTDTHGYRPIPGAFMPMLDGLKYRSPMEYVFHSPPRNRQERKNGLNKFRSISRNALGERYKMILRKLGYGQEYALYSWKHTGAVAVYKKTKNIKALQKHLGHKNIETTDIYIQQLGLEDFGDFYENFPAPDKWL